jgi:16S rRNA (uracil1498-N3)-methyltransferase
MRRFYVRPEDVGDRELHLRGDEANHLVRVLRLGPGAQIMVFDGRGGEYTAEVERLEVDAVICGILHYTEAQPTRSAAITLGQGLPKADKFAWVIQKTTELGVAAIVPLITERVIPRLSQDPAGAKVGRWEKLAREASKQSRRSTVPHLWPPTPLKTFLSSFRHADLKLVLWEGEHLRPLRSVLSGPDQVTSVAVIVGPEGGLTPQEVAQGEAHGFLTVGLGQRMLRAETAGMIAVALLQYQFGDLG